VTLRVGSPDLRLERLRVPADHGTLGDLLVPMRLRKLDTW
jgi:hypothetical protein